MVSNFFCLARQALERRKQATETGTTHLIEDTWLNNNLVLSKGVVFTALRGFYFSRNSLAKLCFIFKTSSIHKSNCDYVEWQVFFFETAAKRIRGLRLGMRRKIQPVDRPGQFCCFNGCQHVPERYCHQCTYFSTVRSVLLHRLLLRTQIRYMYQDCFGFKTVGCIRSSVFRKRSAQPVL